MAEEVGQLSSNRMSAVRSQSTHFPNLRGVLGQDTEPQIAPNRKKVLPIDALYECVCEWVNENNLYCKVL